MSPEPVEADDQQPSQVTGGQRLRSAAGWPRTAMVWAAHHRLKSTLGAMGCLAALGGLVAVYMLVPLPHPATDAVTIDMALDALDRGDYVAARHVAESLRQRAMLPAGDLGGPPFVLGAAAAYETAEITSAKKAAQYLVAARYLEEADKRGFPSGREAEGLYLLGRSLYFAGQIPASRLALHAALKAHWRQPAEIHRLLSDAYLNDAAPKLADALAENALYLADKRLSPAAAHAGSLQRAEILLRQENMAECRATLDKLPAAAKDGAEALVVVGQILLREAQSLRTKTDATADDQANSREKYLAAIETLRKAQSHDTLSARVTYKAMYLIGVCFMEMGEDRAAAGEFARIRAQYPDTPEAVAASFQEAELARKLGHDAEALAAYRRVLGAVADPASYSNPWLSQDQLRNGTMAAMRHYLSLRKFEIALQLTRLLEPLLARARAMELLAEVYQTWAQSLLAEAEHLPPSKAALLRRQGHLQFCNAGRVYWRLSQLQITTRQYPEQLWNSASAYLDGCDYRNTVRILQHYLQYESRQRRPQALVALGEALLALEQSDKALAAFRECIDFHPRDTAAPRARLLASKALLEKGDAAQAEALLRENLNGDNLAPASKQWRDSLCALGELLHDQGRHREAIQRFREAIERYPGTSQALNARYLAADSYRQSAKLAEDRQQAEPSEEARVRYGQQRRELLNNALAEYRQLQEAIGRMEEHGELTAEQKLMLRNCCFAAGDVQFDLGQYEEAIQTYNAVADRYQNYPEVLEAYVQIAAAYRRLNQSVDARSTLEKAKVLLAHMKSDTRFDQRSNFSPQQWQQRLDALAALYSG